MAKKKKDKKVEEHLEAAVEGLADVTAQMGSGPSAKCAGCGKKAGRMYQIDNQREFTPLCAKCKKAYQKKGRITGKGMGIPHSHGAPLA